MGRFRNVFAGVLKRAVAAVGRNPGAGRGFLCWSGCTGRHWSCGGEPAFAHQTWDDHAHGYRYCDSASGLPLLDHHPASPTGGRDQWSITDCALFQSHDRGLDRFGGHCVGGGSDRRATDTQMALEDDSACLGAGSP